MLISGTVCCNRNIQPYCLLYRIKHLQKHRDLHRETAITNFNWILTQELWILFSEAIVLDYFLAPKSILKIYLWISCDMWLAATTQTVCGAGEMVVSDTSERFHTLIQSSEVFPVQEHLQSFSNPHLLPSSLLTRTQGCRFRLWQCNSPRFPWCSWWGRNLQSSLFFHSPPAHFGQPGPGGCNSEIPDIPFPKIWQ